MPVMGAIEIICVFKYRCPRPLRRLHRRLDPGRTGHPRLQSPRDRQGKLDLPYGRRRGGDDPTAGAGSHEHRGKGWRPRIPRHTVGTARIQAVDHRRSSRSSHAMHDSFAISPRFAPADRACSSVRLHSLECGWNIATDSERAVVRIGRRRGGGVRGDRAAAARQIGPTGAMTIAAAAGAVRWSVMAITCRCDGAGRAASRAELCAPASRLHARARALGTAEPNRDRAGDLRNARNRCHQRPVDHGTGTLYGTFAARRLLGHCRTPPCRSSPWQGSTSKVRRGIRGWSTGEGLLAPGPMSGADSFESPPGV
jgi:hypothetical protein